MEKYSLDEVIAATAKVMKMPMRLIISRQRTQHIAFVRQVAMYLCRELTEKSFPDIGGPFDRDHATVIHACRLIERRAANGMAHEIQDIRLGVEVCLQAGRGLHEANGGGADGIPEGARRPNGACSHVIGSAPVEYFGTAWFQAAGADGGAAPSLPAQDMAGNSGLLPPEATSVHRGRRPFTQEEKGRDRRRDRRLGLSGIRTLRIGNREVEQDLEAVRQRITFESSQR